MSQNGRFSLPRSRRHERGQVIIWLVLVWVVFFVLMAAVVADLGVVHCAYRQLQASTDAAALAGAAEMPTQSLATVETTATLYSSYRNGENVYSDMTVANPPTFTLGCSTTEKNQGVLCIDPSGENVLTVTQTATVPLNFLNFFFAQLNGHPSMPITATSEAVMRGAPGPPYNVAVIMDTTQSMNSGTNSCGKTYTPIQCAKQGLQLLLTELQPCFPGVVPCGATAPVDLVSLFVFPAWTTASASSAWTGGTATGAHYDQALGGGPTDIPAAPGGETVTANGTQITYQLIPFGNDYRTSDGAALNPSSDIVLAAGYPYPSNNGHLSAPGGAGTYYAGVIYAAQNALAYQKSLNPLSNNVIIILTDGDANATCADMTAPYNVVYTGNPLRAPGGCSPGTGGNSASYMSATDECQQAILAAWSATKAGTQVYTIGFASEAAGCSTDSTNLNLSSLAASYGVPYTSSAIPGAGITPCDTIEYMASDPEHWFSDSASQCSANGPTPQPANTLPTIIPQITQDLSVARLVAAGT